MGPRLWGGRSLRGLRRGRDRPPRQAADVRNLSAADRSRIKVVLNLDMLAVGDEPQFAGSEPWLSEAMARAASQGYAPRDATAELRNLSDHQSFINAGIPALLFHEEWTTRTTPRATSRPASSPTR